MTSKRSKKTLLLIASSVIIAGTALQEVHLSAETNGCYDSSTNLPCQTGGVVGYCTWEPPNNCACAQAGGTGGVWVNTYYCQDPSYQ